MSPTASASLAEKRVRRQKQSSSPSARSACSAILGFELPKLLGGHDKTRGADPAPSMVSPGVASVGVAGRPLPAGEVAADRPDRRRARSGQLHLVRPVQEQGSVRPAAVGRRTGGVAVGRPGSAVPDADGDDDDDDDAATPPGVRPVTAVVTTPRRPPARPAGSSGRRRAGRRHSGTTRRRRRRPPVPRPR